MSFTLYDNGSENFEFNASVWKWKAAVELIRALDIISDGTARQMSYNAAGIKIDIEDAHRIGETFRDQILPKLHPNKRIFADGTVTDAPDDGLIHRDDDDQWKNYSVDHDWVKEFSEFCLRSKGFQIY